MNKIKFLFIALAIFIFSLLNKNVAKCETGDRYKTSLEGEEAKNLDIKEILRPPVGLQSNDIGILQQEKDPKLSGLNDRPNIIIITIDTLRSDHVGCYGYYRDTTPNIDKFSKGAILFKNAISQANYTLASMASFITSKYPNMHILFDFINFQDENTGTCILNPYYPTLTQELKKAGYATCFISDQPAMFYIKGIKEGFDSFMESSGNSPAGLTKTALKWISGNKNKPFFIWMHYFGPHHPYHPNKASFLNVPLKEKDKNITLAKSGSQVLGAIPKSAQAAEDSGFSNLNYYMNNYDGKILLTDEQIGVLLDGISRLGLDKKSVIVITSDHGEEFGEHNLYCSHTMFHYNTLLQVPLLMKIPSQGLSGKIINETVGLIDVVPTILDILKIKRLNLDGETLLPLIKDSTDKKARNKFIFTAICGKTSITSNGWKLIHNARAARIRLVSGKKKDYEFYNLVSDKYEQNDLSGQNTKVFKRLQDTLKEFEEKADQEIVNKKLILFRERAGFGFINSEDEIDKLRSLGYLN